MYVSVFAAMLPAELQRTILDMSRDPQINVSLYDYDGDKYALWRRIYRTSSGVIEVVGRNHPLCIRTQRGLRAFLCGIEHNLALDEFIVVVHVGSDLPPKSLEDGEHNAARVKNTFGKTLVKDETILASTLYPDEEDDGEAAHKTIERIADYVWDILH